MPEEPLEVLDEGAGITGDAPEGYAEGQTPANNPLNKNSFNAAGALGAAGQVIGTGMEIAQGIQGTKNIDPSKAAGAYYNNNPYEMPTYTAPQTPEEIAKGTGGRAALQYAGKGASAGAALGSAIMPGVGTVIGGAVGALGGAAAGLAQGAIAKKKRQQFQTEKQKRKASYKKALNRYYDNYNKASMRQAQQYATNQRGQDLNSLYNANVYGLGNY